MSPLPIARSASATVRGTRRPSNQDRHLIDRELGFVLLADGVAGRPAGGCAAQVAIDAAAVQLRLVLASGHCRDVGTARQLIDDALRFTNLAVRRRAAGDEALSNMASTLVGVLFVDGHAVMANLGDSRIYRLRHAFLKQVTDDHLLLRKGLPSLSREEILAIRPLQLLTRAVGYHDCADPDVRIERLSAEDVYLLCSNGLSDVLERHRMAEVLAGAPSLEQACSLLVDEALAAGSEDDVTVVLVRPAVARAGDS